MQFKLVLMIFSYFALQNGSAYTLTCGTTITLTLDSGDLTTLHLDPPNVKRFSVSTAQLTAYDPTDACQFESSDTIIFPATGCDAVISRDSTHEIFTFKLFKLVLSGDFPDVARFKDSCLEFVCKFPLQNFISTTFLPTISKAMDNTEAMGTFDFAISLYDVDYITPLVSPVNIVVPDQVYVRVSLVVSGATNLQLEAESCYISKDADRTVLPQYHVITDFCVTSGGDGRAMTINRVGTTVEFSFTSFVFPVDVITNTAYFVHCVLEVCDPTQAGSCAATAVCAKRKRRFAPAKPGKTNKEQHHVSYGPIHFINTCNKNNGGCQEICSMPEDKVKCSCSAGKTLSSNGIECFVEINQGEIVMESSNTIFYYFMAGMVAINVLVLLIAGLVFFKNSPRSSQKGASRFESA